MRLNNINVQRLTNILGAKGKSKKGFALFKTTKTRIIAAALAVTLGAGGVTAAVVGHMNGRQADVPEAPTITNGSETPNDNPTVEDEFGLLADSLDIDGLGMKNDMLTIEEQRQKIAEEMGATYDGPTYEVTDEKGNTTTWVSEEDYEIAVDKGLVDAPAGTTVVDYQDEVFIADDGTPFETAADRDAWNAYLKGVSNGENNTVVETEGNFYTAPDGSVWTSKEEYEKYQNSNDGTKVDTVENGTVIEQGEGYRDPNGDYWTSEAEYLAYINSLKQNTGDVITNDNTGTNTDVSYDDNFYHAPDGSVWASEQEYRNYINSINSSSNDSYTSDSYVDSSDADVSYDDNFYHAPDGSVWASEQEYKNYLNSENSNNNNNNNNSYEDVGSGDVSYEEDNFYHAPDGSVWASEQDYLDYVKSTTMQASSAVYSAASSSTEEETVVAPVEEKQEESFIATDGTAFETAADRDAWNEYLQNSQTASAEEEVVVESQEQASIELDEYGGYIDPETGFYCVNGEFYATKADYVAIMQMDQEESQKTR